MIDDRIGSIGSTHGVRLSSKPSTKKIGITVSNEPDFSALSMRPCSVAMTKPDPANAVPEAGGTDAFDAAVSSNCAVRCSGG